MILTAFSAMMTCICAGRFHIPSSFTPIVAFLLFRGDFIFNFAIISLLTTVFFLILVALVYAFNMATPIDKWAFTRAMVWMFAGIVLEWVGIVALIFQETALTRGDILGGKGWGSNFIDSRFVLRGSPWKLHSWVYHLVCIPQRFQDFWTRNFARR